MEQRIHADMPQLAVVNRASIDAKNLRSVVRNFGGNAGGVECAKEWKRYGAGHRSLKEFAPGGFQSFNHTFERFLWGRPKLRVHALAKSGLRAAAGESSPAGQVGDR